MNGTRGPVYQKNRSFYRPKAILVRRRGTADTAKSISVQNGNTFDGGVLRSQRYVLHLKSYHVTRKSSLF